MRLNQLLNKRPKIKSEHAPEINNIVYDSRQISPGDLYVAVQGSHSDGHDFIPQAIKQGAVAIVCSLTWAERHELAKGISWIPVADTRQALAELSAAFYDSPAKHMKMIGVTGTNGKTTITHLLSQMLVQQQQISGWIGTLGAGYLDKTLPGKYTTPFPPELQAWLKQMRSAGVQAVAMECSSHALEQRRLDSIDFDIAIFSNLSQDHLDYHLNMETYSQAKQILFSRLLKPDGLAVINLNDALAEDFMIASRSPVFTYALEKKADLSAFNTQQDQEGIHFSVQYRGQIYQAYLPMPGLYNLANILAVLSALLGLGFDLTSLIACLPNLNGVPGRLERVSDDGAAFAAYIDYAHTPDSLLNVLQTIRQFTPGKVIVACGCGGDRDKGKRPLMARIAEQEADKVVLTSDNPRSESPEVILEEMTQGLLAPEQALIKIDRRDGIAAALGLASPNDTVLIAGKGHEKYQIIGDQTLPFDDAQIVQEILKGNR